MHYALIYETCDNYEERRKPYRAEHLKLAWESNARGEMILGGAFADPIDGAILVFQGDSPEAATQFAENDPYVINGLIKRWYVRTWTTVVGELASNPIRQ